MAVTLKDIAARTGLSIPTVHQIISGYTVAFSKETRSRVLAVAKELDYRPNLSARSLQQRKSFLLGVLFYSVNNGYASDFVRGLQNVARDKGYAPIFFAHANSAEELQNLEIVLDRHVDALITNVAIDPADGRTNADRFAQVKSNTPVVEVFGRFVEGTPSVRMDYYAAGLIATRRMIEQGHQRIALFTRDQYKIDRVPGLNWAANDFWRGYCDAINQASLEQAVVTFEAGSAVGPYLASGRVLNHPAKPTAVVCASGRTAAALLQYADRNEQEVPKGFEVSAFGRSEAILPREWPVTLFRAPVEKVGAAAAETAFKLINKESAEDVTLPPEEPIVIRRG
jgi:DNA-binding LacI/PurR family transcriptional regulator